MEMKLRHGTVFNPVFGPRELNPHPKINQAVSSDLRKTINLPSGWGLKIGIFIQKTLKTVNCWNVRRKYSRTSQVLEI